MRISRENSLRIAVTIFIQFNIIPNIIQILSETESTKPLVEKVSYSTGNKLKLANSKNDENHIIVQLSDTITDQGLY